MADIIAEIFPLDFTISEIVKTNYRARIKEPAFSGVGVIMVNGTGDMARFQKKWDEKLERHEQRRNPKLMLGNVVIYNSVVPPGKFVAFYIQGGMTEPIEIEIEEEEPEEEKK